MTLAILPLAEVPPAICTVEGANTMADAIFPLAVVPGTIWVRHRALTVGNALSLQWQDVSPWGQDETSTAAKARTTLPVNTAPPWYARTDRPFLMRLR